MIATPTAVATAMIPLFRTPWPMSASVQASAKFCQFQSAGGPTGFVLISPAVLKPLNPEMIQAKTEIIPTTMTNGAIGMHRSHSMDAYLPI